jgi:hypothetical protein
MSAPDRRRVAECKLRELPPGLVFCSAFFPCRYHKRAISSCIQAREVPSNIPPITKLYQTHWKRQSNCPRIPFKLYFFVLLWQQKVRNVHVVRSFSTTVTTFHQTFNKPTTRANITVVLDTCPYCRTMEPLLSVFHMPHVVRASPRGLGISQCGVTLVSSPLWLLQ